MPRSPSLSRLTSTRSSGVFSRRSDCGFCSDAGLADLGDELLHDAVELGVRDLRHDHVLDRQRARRLAERRRIDREADHARAAARTSRSVRARCPAACGCAAPTASAAGSRCRSPRSGSRPPRCRPPLPESCRSTPRPRAAAPTCSRPSHPAAPAAGRRSRRGPPAARVRTAAAVKNSAAKHRDARTTRSPPASGACSTQASERA